MAVEKFRMKRPVKADYIRKYGFEGESFWRWDLIKYTEEKNAWERRNANLKNFQKSQHRKK